MSFEWHENEPYSSDHKPKRKGIPKRYITNPYIRAGIIAGIITFIAALIGAIPVGNADKPLACSIDSPTIQSIYGCSATSDQDISGHWVGRLYQPRGGSQTVYPFEMTISQNGVNITGTSKIDDSDYRYFALTNIAGGFENGTLRFAETTITEQDQIPGFFWCLKYGTLHLADDVLEGTWGAEGCQGGTLKLEKVDQ